MNKKTGIILAVVIANLVLVGTVITLYFTVFQKGDQEEGMIIITGLVDQQINLTLTDIELMPNITKNYVILGNPNINASYTGVPLEYLIMEVANVSANYLIRVKAIDGLAKAFYLNELLSYPGFIIAYKRDGEYIQPRTEGGNGPFRLIVPQEYATYNGQYCVKYVTEIEILDL